MNGTFYRIPVTKELSDAVVQGTNPPTETHILCYILALLVPGLLSFRMLPLDNRREIIACLEAFKQFLGA
jgi:hypothetical protein